MTEERTISSFEEAKTLLMGTLVAEPKNLHDIAAASVVLAAFTDDSYLRDVHDDGTLDTTKVVMVPVGRMLALHTALLQGDLNEAYHQLYQSAHPNIEDGYTAWKNWFDILDGRKPDVEQS